MDIVKKNLISIICGVVALLCVGLIFYPLGGMYDQVTADVKKSKEVGDAIGKVAKEPRFWPTLSTKEEDRVPLKQFPTEATNAVGTQITNSWTQQTTNFADAALRVQADALKPLVPGVLPSGGGVGPAYRFKDLYIKLMGPAGTTGVAAGGFGGGGFGGGGFGGAGDNVRPNANAAPVPTGPPAPVLNTPLIGRLPPSEFEIKDRADRVEAGIRQSMPIYVNGAVQNQVDVDLKVAEQRAAVGDRLRQDVARQSMVYLDPAVSFIAHTPIATGQPPSLDDIFLAQVGLWLQQEICRSIHDTNKPAIDKGQQGVLDAPIKRLIGVRFALPYGPPAPVAGAPGAATPTDVPALPPMPTAKVALDFLKNPLGQTTNDLYDVLPFNLAIVCEAETLPATLAGLGRNRYISVRSLDVQTVDAAVAYTQGFIYGNKPVVQISLRGQYLILRRFIGPLMPPNIIRGILAPTAPGAVPGGIPGSVPGGGTSGG